MGDAGSAERQKAPTAYRRRAQRALNQQLALVDSAGRAFDAYGAVKDEYAKQIAKLNDERDRKLVKAHAAYQKRYEAMVADGVSAAVLAEAGLPDPVDVLPAADGAQAKVAVPVTRAPARRAEQRSA